MIKAVIFDMFETLVSLFEGRTYFGEHIAADVGADLAMFRKEWNSIEKDRSIGTYTIEEGVAEVLKRLDIYSEEKVRIAAAGRMGMLNDTFSAIPDATFELLDELKNRGLKIGLMTNSFSDERDIIRESKLFPYFDAVLISYEQGMFKPDPDLYKKMTEMLDVVAKDCLYVGDGGSMELYAARNEGMKAVQCTWFRHMAYEPHVLCPVYDDFEHVERQKDVLNFLT